VAKAKRTGCLRRVAFLTMALAGALLSMFISYHTVRHLSEDLSMVDKPAPEMLRYGQCIRSMVNRLYNLSRECEARIPSDSKGIQPKHLTWLQGDFLRRLRPCQEQLRLATPEILPLDALESHHNLSAAMERLASMASHPKDIQLRRHALNDIREAMAASEVWIERTGMAPFLTESPRLKP
jgi:hypothetical protein